MCTSHSKRHKLPFPQIRRSRSENGNSSHFRNQISRRRRRTRFQSHNPSPIQRIQNFQEAAIQATNSTHPATLQATQICFTQVSHSTQFSLSIGDDEEKSQLSGLVDGRRRRGKLCEFSNG
ncbi:hypothetical protein Droror1_Dr00019827 [Drosera rotundifolia]